jgi:hypothetical protein
VANRIANTVTEHSGDEQGLGLGSICRGADAPRLRVPSAATGTTPEGITTYFTQVFVSRSCRGACICNQLMDALTCGNAAPPPPAQHQAEDVKEGLAIQENTQITLQLFAGAKYELRDSVSGEVLDHGTARAIAAYNVVDSQFSTQSAERDAQERAAREVGEDIRLRLGLYFENRFGAKS